MEQKRSISYSFLTKPPVVQLLQSSTHPATRRNTTQHGKSQDSAGTLMSRCVSCLTSPCHATAAHPCLHLLQRPIWFECSYSPLNAVWRNSLTQSNWCLINDSNYLLTFRLKLRKMIGFDTFAFLCCFPIVFLWIVCSAILDTSLLILKWIVHKMSSSKILISTNKVTKLITSNQF